MRRTILFLLLAALSAAGVAFTADGDATFERGQEETYYLRWTPPSEGTDCGDDRYLSTTAGTDDVVCTQLYATAVDNIFSTRGMEPILLDALDDITGTIDLGPAVGVTHGIAVVDATVRITAGTDSGTKTLGTHTEQLVVTPASTVTRDAVIDFALDVDDELDAAELSFLTISISLEGPQVLPWNFNLDGASFFDVPFLVEVEPVPAPSMTPEA